MSWIDPITDYGLSRFLFIQARFMWVGAGLLLCVSSHLMLYSPRLKLDPSVREALYWSRYPTLLGAVFNGVFIAAIFITPTANEAAQLIWANLEWLALLMVLTTYTIWRATKPLLKNSNARAWAWAFGGAVLGSQALGALLWTLRGTT